MFRQLFSIVKMNHSVEITFFSLANNATSMDSMSRSVSLQLVKLNAPQKEVIKLRIL